MSATFYVGAYWGARREDVEPCARRLQDFLERLSDIDSQFATWFRTGRSRRDALRRRVDPTREGLTELLLAGRHRRDTGSVMEDLGYSIGMWNGREPDAGLSVHCGGYTAVAGILNSCVVELPPMSAESEALYEVGVARSLMAAVVECWEPDWATWTSHELRESLPFQTGEVIVGWMTYLSSSLLSRESRLPALPDVEDVGDGVLITLGGDPAAVSADDLLALRHALGGAVASEDV